MTFSLFGAVSSLIVTILVTIGLPGLFALMVVACVGVPPLPSEVILLFAGFLVAGGTYSFGAALTVALAGGLCGAFAAYAIGRWWRHRITGLGLGHLRLEPRHLKRVDAYFARYGETTVGLGQMVPVLRAYISYPAGTAEMPAARFGVFTLLGALPYSVALMYAGTVLKSKWTEITGYFSLLNLPLIAVVVGIVVYLALQIAGVLAPGWPPRRARPATVNGPGLDPEKGPPT